MDRTAAGSNLGRGEGGVGEMPWCLKFFFFFGNESMSPAGAWDFDRWQHRGGSRKVQKVSQMPVPGKAPFLERTTIPRSRAM